MTEHVRQMKKLVTDRNYREKRSVEVLDFSDAARGKDDYGVFCTYLQMALNSERLLLHEGDVFGFNRSYQCYALCKDKDTDLFPASIRCNIAPDYSLMMEPGLDELLQRVHQKRKQVEDPELYLAAECVLESIIRFADSYAQAALQAGNNRLYQALRNVPRNRPNSLYEACVFQKIIIFMLRITKHEHVTLGRFDQYMYPYFKADLERGVSKEELFETLELYFLSLNLDADTYIGMQQGDNGQSMVLGGFDLDGNSVYNELSQMCMEASLELEVIDPKINLRVSRNTPDEQYELGTRLTKKGLGFPQYCNDDVVVPGLIKLGYAPEDAVNYAVAACWEFIVPGKGLDVPNVTAMNFPLVIDRVLHSSLMKCDSFEELMLCVEQGICEEIANIMGRCNGMENMRRRRRFDRSPLMSLLTNGCLETGKDYARFGSKYYNFGCHGAGISSAADALAAVKKMIYDTKQVDKQTLLMALDRNFEGYAPFRNQLLSCPKMGSDDDYVDTIGGDLMDMFAKHLNGKPNGLGGIWRAGTGCALEYIRCGKACGATADGRLAGEPLASSFSPSLQARPAGPLSTIRSFTKFDLTNIINGGPLTMEIHDNVFRNAEGEKKVAAMVKLFVLSGGHQLQLNAINRERLVDAKENPQNYPNLVVRVWGWSGYFRELDPEYQDHIIQRTQYVF